ncbi:hypothetical protein HY496_01320 [Candidatus Woesearchaeota archaeon]|nr:hypothetical protein [Candidatus Woesearchaeota archaeon]
MTRIHTNSVIVVFQSVKKEISLPMTKIKYVDIDDNSIYDLGLTLLSVNKNRARIEIVYVQKKADSSSPEKRNVLEKNVLGKNVSKENETALAITSPEGWRARRATLLSFVLFLTGVIAVGLYFLFRKKMMTENQQWR